MRFLFSFSLLVFALQMQSDISYLAKKEIRKSDRQISKQWSLKLKWDKSFEFTIIRSDVNKIKISKDTLSFHGLWEHTKDTILLHSTELTKYCKKEVHYKIKGDYLYSMGSKIDSIDGFRFKALQKFSNKN